MFKEERDKIVCYWLCSFAMYWWYLLGQGVLLGLMAFKNPECLINKFPIDEDDSWANSVRWMSDTLVLEHSICLNDGYIVLKVSMSKFYQFSANSKYPLWPSCNTINLDFFCKLYLMFQWTLIRLIKLLILHWTMHFDTDFTFSVIPFSFIT